VTPRRSGPKLALLVLLLAATLIVWATNRDHVSPGKGVGTIAARLMQTDQLPRDRQPYAGLGTWVDGFDFGPAYQTNQAAPSVAPKAVEAMAANGVKTVFLLAVRDDPRSPGGVVDRALVGEFLIRAHRSGLRVVGWYLPKFVDASADLAHLRQISDFAALGHRFDGVAVDIEDVEDVTDVAERSQRLLDVSTRLRAASGADALGAIVLPPVLTEVVNTAYWPDFPWPELRPLYDVWLPMSYWTFRRVSSGYHDGYTYNDESVRRLRNNLGDQSAVVHAIGGIGDAVTAEELGRFALSLMDDRAVGGSVYDWSSMTSATRAALAEQFATGPAARLAPPTN
jgi:hypothetical protein